MRRYLASSIALGLLGVVVACSSSDRSGFGEPPKVEAEGGATPSLGGDAANTLTVSVNVTGIVYAPNGTLPLSNALVYISSEPPPAIPAGAYCDTCVKLL